MPASAFDSLYLRDRFGTPAMRAIWDDRATIQRWLDVEAALARVQAELGLVPAGAARAIADAARVDRIDLAAMSREFARTWNPVLPLVNALRARLPATAAAYVHWGATSKNVMDTALALQIRASLALLLDELGAVERALARLARRHRDTLMAGRTHGQHALPITFGFRCAVWLDELMRQRERLQACRRRALVGEWGGAVGSSAALGRRGREVERRLLRRLGLGVPRLPVKTAGDRFAELFLLLAMLSATLGKLAQNLYNLQQTDVDEASEFLEGKIGSSAMPHKLNPVASGSVVLLGRLLRARAPLMLDYIHAEGEDDHRQGETAWAFPQEVCLLASAQLAIGRRLLETLVVKPGNMLRNLERAGGVVLSEAVMMALAPRLGRDRAHELVRRVHRASLKRGVPFREAVRREPQIAARLSPRQLDRALDYRRSLGQCASLVDRVLKDWERGRRRSHTAPSD
jgi:adenylosuccinate lyase